MGVAADKLMRGGAMNFARLSSLMNCPNLRKKKTTMKLKDEVGMAGA